MLKHFLLHPQINAILGRAGHHARVLIADGNYPASTKKGPQAELVCLNLSPGIVTVAQVLRAVLSAVPVDEINTMGIPPDDPYAKHGEPAAWSDFRRIAAEAGIGDELKPIPKWEFYEAVASPDHVLTIQTADQALWANVLLTIGLSHPMKAFLLVEHGAPGRFELRDVPEPKAAPGEVVVQVRACGLNHLDLWLEEAGLPVPVQLPRVPGGEVSGTIASLGDGVSGWSVGERVAIQSNLFCGRCEFCQRGEESMCLENRLLGVQCDGGFAERCVVPARALVRLPDGVSDVTSAALTLAGSTAMHMLTDRTQVQPGQWVLVIGGASGVGSAAIQIARGLGAHVITTASTPAKAEFCRELGAEQVVDPADRDWPAKVRQATGKRGADVVVEHVGGSLLEQVFQCLARGGTIVTCGATAGREVRLNLWPLFVKQQRLVGSYGRTRRDMVATLDWAAQGKLRAAVDEVLPLERGAEAFRRLRERAVRGKLVLTPAGVS